MASKCHLGKNAYTTLNIIATTLFYLLLRVVIVERLVLSMFANIFFVQNLDVNNLETRKRIQPAFCRNPCSSAVTEFRIAIIYKQLVFSVSYSNYDTIFCISPDSFDSTSF